MINLNGNSSSSRQVTFITHPSIQSKAFASYLSETLMAPVVLQNINKPLAQRLAKDSVILFDIAVSNKKLNGVWRDIIRLQADNPRLLIINSAQKYELYEMAQWPALYGVFRHDDDESRLIEGVKAVLNGELPYSIGGGTGQSRLCMLLLGSVHIGEVQASVWDEATRETCAKAGIPLL